MLRLLIHALAILHLGPGIAFALLAFGCDPPDPWLGAACGRGQMRAFVSITLASWAVMGLGLWLLERRRTRTAQSARPPAATT